MSMLSITIIFMAWGDVIRSQYLIPLEYDKIYIVSAFLGAGVNLIFNLIFIPKLYSIGACIGTIIAEFIVAFYQSFKVRKKLEFNKYIKEIIPFFFKALIMFLCAILIGKMEINVYIKLFWQLLFSCIVYFILNYNYINSLINFKKINKKIKKNTNKC